MRTKLFPLMATCSLLMSMAAGSAEAATVKIAFVDPLSGSLAASGQAALHQIQSLAEFSNQRKWAGDNTIEVTGFDTKGSPQEALVQLKTIIDQDYHYVVQGAGSGVALALIDAINKHNERNPGKEVLLLNYAAADPALTNSKCSFWHFRFDANSDMKVEVLTAYMAKDPKIKKVYLIHQNYAAGQQFQRATLDYLKRKRPDIQIVGDDMHPIGQVKDFSPYVAKMRASGADTVVTANWGNDAALLIKGIKESGLTINVFAPYATTTGVPTVMGESGVGRVKGLAVWHANADIAAAKDIIEFHKKKFDEDLAVAGNYPLMAVFSQALKLAKSTNPIKVAYAMEGLKMTALNGEVEMRKLDHQLLQPLYVMDWVKINGKDIKYDQEKTGLGWKTIQKIDTYVATQPTSCEMKRPPN